MYRLTVKIPQDGKDGPMEIHPCEGCDGATDHMHLAWPNVRDAVDSAMATLDSGCGHVVCQTTALHILKTLAN